MNREGTFISILFWTFEMCQDWDWNLAQAFLWSRPPFLWWFGCCCFLSNPLPSYKLLSPQAQYGPWRHCSDAWLASPPLNNTMWIISFITSALPTALPLNKTLLYLPIPCEYWRIPGSRQASWWPCSWAGWTWLRPRRQRTPALAGWSRYR